MIRSQNRRGVYFYRCMLTLNNQESERADSMRGTEPEGETLYECIDCGERERDPDGRLCSCGGYLKNIGVGRAL